MNTGITSILLTSSVVLALFILPAGAAQVEAAAAVKKKPAPPAQNHKAHSNSAQTASPQKSVTTANSGLLAEAYHLLSRADHDYKGHRIRAMHQISAAAKLLGMSLHHDGRGGENQLTSDEQLREAQALLGRALSFYAGRATVLEHLNAAHTQLSVALRIR